MKNINFSQKQMMDGHGLSLRYPISIRIVKALSRTVAVLTFLLTLGVGQMRGDSGFFSTGQWKIGYNDGSDHWIDYQDDGATVDLGIKTQLSLIGCNVNTWGYVKTNLDWWKSFGSSLDAVDNGTGNFWSIYADWDGNHEWYMDCNDYDMIAGASNNPGNNTLYMRWSLRNYNTKTGQAKITFTIPGFTTTSTSQTFNNTTVSSNSSETISFGTHYGTTLTTSNCSITGTNASDFSVTAITESGVTVKFTPTATGSRSATLTITDAHSKTCTITLSGTGTAPAETTHSVTVSYVCTSPSATVSTATTPTIGEVTYSEQTAPTVAGYTFVNWTLGNGVSVKSGDTNTSNPIHVKTLSSGTYTLTANYTEDLTSTWKIVGQSPSDKANSPFSSWTYASSTNTMAKATGHSTESVVYATISVPAASVTGDYYEFKVTGDGSTLYGYGESGEDNITFDVTKTNQTVYSNSNNDHALRFKPNVAGDYTFKVDYSGNDPKVSVTFPTSYTVNFGVSPTGAADAPTNDKSISNGGLVLSSTNVTFTAAAANTGYTWDHWEVGGENVGTSSTYTTSITAATTVTAVYTEDTHTVTVAKDATGGGNISTTSVSAGVATASATITATPANLAWRFKNWTVPNGVTIASGSTTSASITINATEDSKTITANFEPRYGLVGSRIDGTTADGMPLWNNAEAADFEVTSFTDKDNMSLTCSRTLSANSDYKFQVWDRESNARRGGDSDATMTLGSSWKLTGSCVISFDTKGAGTYTFEITAIDESNYQPSIQINAVNSYTVTFGHGTGGTAETASGSVSGSITSGQYVAAGEDITFTQTPATGYTFKGWYTTAEGNTAVTGMGVSDPVLDDIAANATVYAQYTEDMHTITVLAGTHGTITTPAGGSGETVSAGIATSAAIVAEVADYGYYFQGWTVESGTATIADASALSTTVTATSDATIKANFVSHWTIAGGDSGEADGSDAMGDWSTVANGIDNFTEVEDDVWEGYADIDLPANTTFYFKVRDLYDGSAWYGNTGEMTYTNYENWSMTLNTSNCRITTAGKGTYRFTWNETNKTLTVTYPTSYTVAYSVYTFLGDDESNSESTTGGSITSVVDGDDIALTSGKYVVNGGTAVFTHSTPTTNYHFDGWYSDAACEMAYVDGEGGAAIDDEDGTLTLSSLAADKTVYAKFAENMTTVTLASTAGGHIEIGGATVTSTTAGAITTRSLTPVANTGYYFAGWTKTSGTDYSISGTENNEDNTTITLTGGGAGETTGQTLTAHFVELEKVYFRNRNEDSNLPLWENVYVYFNISWDGNKAFSNSNAALTAVEMQQEGTSNVYWAYVPRTVTRNGYDDIAFSNKAFTTSFGFYQYEAVARGDYKTGWDMFVPQHSNTSEVNYTTYYNGYWKHHNMAVGTDAGYRIERYNGSGYETPADNGGDRLKFLVTSENTIQYQLRVDNLTSGYNNYMIYNVGGTHYITFNESVEETGYTVTTSNCTDIGLSEYNSGSPRFYITPTSEGIYTLTIDMSGDVMRLSVTYPVSVGDYMLVHSYNDGSAKTSKSDIIKTSEVSDRLYSMFIDNNSAHSPSLVLKKCTALTEGVPTWSAGESVSMTGFGTTGGFTADTAGVFQFSVAIANDAATLSDIAVYSGSYYIKTDCADGGWTAYTSNVMEENTISFDESDASTYDYYYCKWVESNNTTNVKCVIANDYCIALSDTLEGDDILGGAQVLPYDANVRFSYNSVTNTVQRAYINGANDWQRSFLNISAGSEVIRGRYRNSWLNSTTYDSTFTDKNNWIYQVDLQAKPGARVKLTANYRYGNADHIQYFYGASGDYTNANTEQIVGGTADEWFTMRAVYDFKTNKLLVGLLANGDTYSSEKTINADLLVVRGNQSSAQQLNFTESGSLAEVDTVYGILQFDKTFLGNNSKTVYERSLYWVSFPFNVNLKDVFGFGEYGTHWILEYYDGEARAREKFWAESDGFWKFVTPSMRDTGYILQANVGYVVGLDLDYFADTITYANTTWANGVRELSLYFPSNSRVGSINNASQEIQVPAHTCTTTRDNRHIWDSNWNIIGVPSYANITGLEEQDLTTLRNQLTGGLYSTDNLRFFYAWNPSSNALKLDAIASDSTFKTMYGYMTQYAGTITWSSTGGTLSAPRRDNAEQKEFYNIKLSVAQDGVDIDHTYIELRDDATETYDMNLDLVKAANAGMTDIYTLVDDVEMGGNCLPIANTVTIVPVGLRTVASTDYTFSLPNGSDGIEVTLIDYLNNTETNLSLGDYTTHIDKGTCNNRFALRLNRAKVVTAIEGAENGEMQSAGNEKVVIDGTLYIRQADGSVFDAQGKRVK